MTTDVAVGRLGTDAMAAARQGAVSTASVRAVVATYVNYRSLLPTRRTSNASRQSEVVVGEDQIDGATADDSSRFTTDLPPGLEHVVRVLAQEFEQRYEQASTHLLVERGGGVSIPIWQWYT